MNSIIEIIRQEPVKTIEISPSVIRGKDGQPLQIREYEGKLQAKYADEQNWTDLFDLKELDIASLKRIDKEISDLGYLYNGYAAINPNLAADGWRIMSEDDWLLIRSEHSSNASENYMIEGLQYWTAGTGINELGMSLKGGGYRYDTFYDIKNWLAIWMKDELGVAIMDWFGPNQNTGSPYEEALYVGAYVLLVREEPYMAENGTIVPEAYTGNDGKKYDGIVIGGQLILLQCLAETKYKDGSDIPVIEDDFEWENATSDARCAYDNEELNAVMIIKNLINHQFLSEAAYEYLKANNLIDQNGTLYYTP